MHYGLTALLLATIGLSAGCSKDRAKFLEARTLAICGCKNVKCITEARKKFAETEKSQVWPEMTEPQKLRAAEAMEKLQGCLKKSPKS